ncbi:MAG: HEAT repeat domain-containing protein, partial [Phycisphaeraceae bacterium]
VYLLEGGDSGWSMTFQYMQDRGPWERERIWELANEDQPAWTLPPLYHLSAGPSGFEYNPGLGLPTEYDEHFFLADFRGGASNSGLHTFKLDQNGAGFEIVNPRQFVWNMLATDMKFGYDGKLYIADWEGGWGMKNPPTGRLHTLAHSEHMNDAAEAQVAELIREDFAAMPADELGDLLNHRDMRIRMRAQFALADQTQSDSDAAVLRTIAADASNDFVPARLHAVWGMGQVLRAGRTFVLDDLLERLDDQNYHVRAQAAKVIGDAAVSAAGGEAVRSALAQNDRIAPLIANLSDEAPHVQALTAIALGKIGDEAAFEPLLRLLHENDDADPYLRHGAIMGIFGTSDADTLINRAATASSAQRLGIVLALRRHQDARLTQFLDDVEPHIVREAATAIYDMNVTDAMPALASLLNRYTRQLTQAKEEPTFELAYYRNIEGNTIASLREATKFPAEPDDVDETVSLATPANTADEYGTRITGFIEPTQSGEHVFLVAADDSAEVYLSTSESPDDKRLIASAPQWTEMNIFDKYPEQQSDPIELVAGERYYIEVLHKEGKGGEHLIVGWRKPDGTQEVPIGGSEETAPVELLRRAINANLAVGTQEAAARVARFAADVTQPTVLRAEALEVLAVWSQPPLRDRVLNYTRPLEERDDQLVREALEPLIVTL